MLSRRKEKTKYICHNQSKLWLYFTGIIFSTIMGVFILVLILCYMEIIPMKPVDNHMPVLMFFLGSMVIGGMVTLFVGRLMIRPIQKISNAFVGLSKGDFSVSVPTNETIEEIRDMAVNFNAMVYDLSRIETLQSDFVVNVSHEFKTPLAAIEGYATLLQNTNLSEDKKERYVEIILENTKRLTEMSTNILALSKLENQEKVLDQKEYRLDEQLRMVVLLLENKWVKKKIEFDISLPKLYYTGNEQILNQVWYNILDNAIKHSKEEGVITISIKKKEKYVEVKIRDEGEGMSKEVQKHIFEKFYQGDESRKREGNGLGLALVKRIIELCQGEILVHSEPGKGSVFTVRLPK